MIPLRYHLRNQQLSLQPDKPIEEKLYWTCKLKLEPIVIAVRKYYNYKELFLDEYQYVYKPIQSSALNSLQS